MAELPPDKVMVQYGAIIKEVENFRNSPTRIPHTIALLKNVRKDVRTIRKILGKNNAAYLKISTMVVNCAFNKVIEEVNATQDTNCTLKRWKVKKILYLAWIAIDRMDKYDMEAEFRKKRYESNRTTLQDICRHFHVSTDSISMGWMMFISVSFAIAIIGGIIGVIYTENQEIGFLIGFGRACIFCVAVGLIWKCYVNNILLKI